MDLNPKKFNRNNKDINFLGKYRAIVVDNEDLDDNKVEIDSGRVKVRIYGIHTLDDGRLKDEHLPYATPAHWQVDVPQKDEKVWVMFPNGNHMHPVYFSKALDKPYFDKFNEDVLASVQNVQDAYKEDVDKFNEEFGIEIEKIEVITEEEEGTKFIKNRYTTAIRTEKSIILINKEEGKESFYIMHKDNMHKIDQDGNEIHLVGGNNTENIKGMSEIFVHGNWNIRSLGNTEIRANDTSLYFSKNDLTIESEKGNITVNAKEGKIEANAKELKANIEENADLTIGGNVNASIEGNNVATVGGNQTSTIQGDLEATCEGTALIEGKSSITVNSDGSTKLNAKDITLDSNTGTTIKATAGSINIQAAQKTTIIARGALDIKTDNRVNIEGKKGFIVNTNSNAIINARGETNITGRNVTVDGRNVTIKGSQNVVIEGKKATVKAKDFELKDSQLILNNSILRLKGNGKIKGDTLTVEAQTLNVKSTEGSININGADSVVANTRVATINASQEVNIKSSRITNIFAGTIQNLEAQEINITSQFDTTITAQNSCIIRAIDQVDIRSSNEVLVDAPSVNITSRECSLTANKISVVSETLEANISKSATIYSGDTTVNTKGNTTITTRGNTNIDSNGNIIITSNNGKVDITAKAKVFVTSLGNNCEIYSANNTIITSKANTYIRSAQNCTIDTCGNLSANTKGDANIRTVGNATIFAGGRLKIAASDGLDLHSGGSGYNRSDEVNKFIGEDFELKADTLIDENGDSIED